MKNKQQLIENPEKGSKRQNREMAVVTYLVMAIFFILAGYMVYFIIHDSDQVLNNSANKRQELLAKRVTKGKIYRTKETCWQRQLRILQETKRESIRMAACLRMLSDVLRTGKPGWRHQKVIPC